MLMTAAGTIAPARVLIMGAGVAGLQAIATARRLGAVVSAFDVRPAVKEQVESLGARFLELGVQGEETEGGYAKELTPEQQAAQQAALEERLPDFDVVITTALDPRPPRSEADPRLGRREHASRQLHRRPRRRGRRQLRAHPARHRDRPRGRHDRRLHEPAVDDVVPREPAVLPQRPLAAAAPRARRRAGARLRATRSPPAPALPASPRLPPHRSPTAQPAPDAPEEEPA